MAVSAYKEQCQPITEALVLGTEVGLVEVADGKKTFSIWISRLKDARGRALIRARIARIRTGNFGDCEPVGEGVFELKIHHGPGYRVYFTRAIGELLTPREGSVVLLLGGDKSSQQEDILKARRLCAAYKESVKQ